MAIYEYTDYKRFLQDLIQSMPRNGHGQARRLAEHLSVNSVVISQVLSGTRHFTPEQGVSVAAYFGFDEAVTDYFVNLIQKDRSGTKDLENFYEKKLQQARKAQLDLKNRIVEFKELSDEDKSIFYSNWYYIAVRIVTALPGVDNIDAIASYLGLSRAKVASVVQFLVSRGLCSEENGKISSTLHSIYLPADSAFINNHRRNWRIKGLAEITEPGPNDAFVSMVYALSASDVERIRKEIADLISKFSKIVRDSPEEKLACLNIDWFEF